MNEQEYGRRNKEAFERKFKSLETEALTGSLKQLSHYDL